MGGGCKKCANMGEKNPAWRGDKVKQRSGNARALRKFPMKDICEQCSNKADVRHHKDEDTANNEPGNILFLCHKCHNGIHKKERDKNGKFVCHV